MEGDEQFLVAAWLLLRQAGRSDASVGGVAERPPSDENTHLKLEIWVAGLSSESEVRLARQHVASAVADFGGPGSSQFFAICCVAVTCRPIPCSILQFDRNKRCLEAQICEASNSTLVRAASAYCCSCWRSCCRQRRSSSSALYHLRTIQRDKAIEAAIQRDYQQVLAIAEKRIDERAYEWRKRPRKISQT